LGYQLSPILKKIEEKIHPTSLRERILHSLYRLNVQREKLNQMSLGLQQRDREMFQRCVSAQLNNDMAHAKIYANECAEIRKIAREVLSSQLAIEKSILRLETVTEFGDLLVQLSPVIEVVNEAKGKISGVVPEVASELDVVNNMLGSLTTDLTTEGVETSMGNVDMENYGEEAKKVLQESNVLAEQRIKEQFPELPTLETPTAPSVTTASAITPPVAEKEPAVLAEGEVDVKHSFKELVYDYIKSHRGVLSLSRCAFELGSTAEDVRKALDELRNEGKISIEQP